MLKEELQSRIKTIDSALEEYLAVHDNPQKSIYEAMRYSVFAGGKRLRPILMTEFCRICGGSLDEIIPFACAIEMIHTYSLIHDDLPAMDNDDLRRGMPTSHIKFGEAQAILAGDALLNKAFEIVCGYNGTHPSRALRAMKILADSSGTEGMIGGQVVDIESEHHDITLDELKHIQLLKTGAIIRSSCKIGAVMAGADEEKINAADEFAKNLGAAFQICDDVLDVTGSEKELGKPIGSDAQSKKNTYVTIMGIEKSKELINEYTKNAIDALAVFGHEAEFLIELAKSLKNRTS